jgi:PAS domain S-box-containing protein
MGANCCSFAPDKYDPYDSPIISETLLHAADIVCCSSEMREAFIRYLINKSWLPKYLEHQKLDMEIALFDLPAGRTLLTRSPHHDHSAALYRAKSEMFRSKRAISVDRDLIDSQQEGSKQLPTQDPLLALAESFIIFLVAGVLPLFLASREFLEWAGAHPLNNSSSSSLHNSDPNLLKRSMTSPQSSQILSDKKQLSFVDHDLHTKPQTAGFSRRPERRRSSITLLVNGWSNPKRYFGRQSVTLVKPLILTNEQQVLPFEVSVPHTQDMDQSLYPVHDTPHVAISTTSRTSANTRPMNKTISIQPMNESVRMERIINDVLDAVKLSELDHMLHSTNWLHSLLQTLDELPLCISIALFTKSSSATSDTERNNSSTEAFVNRKVTAMEKDEKEEAHSLTVNTFTSLSSLKYRPPEPLSSFQHPLIYVNQSFENLTLYPRDDVLGHTCNILQDANFTEKEQALKLNQALESLKPTKVGLTNVRKDGSSFFNLVSLKPLVHHDRDGGKYCKFIVAIQYALQDGKDLDFSELLAIDDLLRLLSNILS